MYIYTNYLDGGHDILDNLIGIIQGTCQNFGFVLLQATLAAVLCVNVHQLFQFILAINGANFCTQKTIQNETNWKCQWKQQEHHNVNEPKGVGTNEQTVTGANSLWHNFTKNGNKGCRNDKGKQTYM